MNLFREQFMKRIKNSVVFVTALALSAPVFGTTVNLYVDSAPNVYGSPNWAPWWAQTKSDVAGGSFQNLRTGTYPGTLRIDPYDEIVYSTDDLGKRLHWIYWIPDKTVSELNNLFQVKWVIDWDGDNWTYDWSANNWMLDGPNAGWVQPASWTDFNGGVIGTFGFAWWASDDDAPPGSTNSNPYDETNQADIDALRSLVFNSQTFAEGFVRYRESETSPWQITSLRVTIPDSGGSLGMMLVALIGLFGIRRRTC